MNPDARRLAAWLSAALVLGGVTGLLIAPALALLWTVLVLLGLAGLPRLLAGRDGRDDGHEGR